MTGIVLNRIQLLDKCCKKGKTVTIVKDTNGKVFGGYTDLEFDGS